MEYITVKARIKELYDSCGSFAAIAKETGVGRTYVAKLAKYTNITPSDATLEKLGLRKQIRTIYNAPNCSIDTDIQTVLNERIAALLSNYGTYEKIAEHLCITGAYLWRLRNGDKSNPSDAILAKLGIAKTLRETYHRIESSDRYLNRIWKPTNTDFCFV